MNDMLFSGENIEFKVEVQKQEKYPERQIQSITHRLSRHQLSRSMPEQIMIEVIAEHEEIITDLNANAEHENVISLRSSVMLQYKYPEAQSLPPPAKFPKSRPRSDSRTRFERTRSVDSINFNRIDLAEPISDEANSCSCTHARRKIKSNPDDLLRPMQLASTMGVNHGPR